MNILYIYKTMKTFSYFVLILLIIEIRYINTENLNGYIVYCPCMGRFGNQADQFLGALGFAKGLNRTLVLPPWVEYRFGEPRSIQVPFDTYFQTETLNNYTRVITMEKFMKTIASEVWPPDKRISFCYVSRGENNDCNAKEGNPFGSFWDTFNVDFVGSEFYEPLNYDVHHRNMINKWNLKFPIQEWPVLAFTGTPGSFPVQIENVPLQKYLVWNNEILNKAKKYINENLPKGGFIGIHLRNGVDWVRVCEHVPYSPNLFSAPQCVGYRNEKGVATQEMCMPTREIIIKKLKRLLKKMKNSVKSIFVASDSNHMIKELSDTLQRFNISIHKLDTANPHVELAILGLSNHFIGNCISSFSAFVKRERDCNHLPSSFWAYPNTHTKKTVVYWLISPLIMQEKYIRSLIGNIGQWGSSVLMKPICLRE